jgi:hypothetical protein
MMILGQCLGRNACRFPFGRRPSVHDTKTHPCAPSPAQEPTSRAASHIIDSPAVFLSSFPPIASINPTEYQHHYPSTSFYPNPNSSTSTHQHALLIRPLRGCCRCCPSGRRQPHHPDQRWSDPGSSGHRLRARLLCLARTFGRAHRLFHHRLQGLITRIGDCVRIRRCQLSCCWYVFADPSDIDRATNKSPVVPTPTATPAAPVPTLITPIVPGNGTVASSTGAVGASSSSATPTTKAPASSGTAPAQATGAAASNAISFGGLVLAIGAAVLA